MRKTDNKCEQDWFDNLAEDQQQSVMKGLKEADRGETITHEEAVIRLGLASEFNCKTEMLFKKGIIRK